VLQLSLRRWRPKKRLARLRECRKKVGVQRWHKEVAWLGLIEDLRPLAWEWASLGRLLLLLCSNMRLDAFRLRHSGSGRRLEWGLLVAGRSEIHDRA